MAPERSVVTMLRRLGRIEVREPRSPFNKAAGLRAVRRVVTGVTNGVKTL